MCAWIKNHFIQMYSETRSSIYTVSIFINIERYFFCSQLVTSSEPQFSEQPAYIFHSTHKMTFYSKKMKAVVSMCFLYLYYALSNYIEIYFPLCCALSVVILILSVMLF